MLPEETNTVLDEGLKSNSSYKAEEDDYYGEDELPDEEDKEEYQEEAVALEESPHLHEPVWEEGKEELRPIKGRYGH